MAPDASEQLFGVLDKDVAANSITKYNIHFALNFDIQEIVALIYLISKCQALLLDYEKQIDIRA